MAYDGDISTYVEDGSLQAFSRDVRALIVKGWVQGHYEFGQHWCIMGAMQAVWRTNQQFEAYQSHVLAAIQRRPGGVFMSIIEWNDKPGRKKAEVMELLDEVDRDIRVFALA
jgi:hypothetical protein